MNLSMKYLILYVSDSKRAIHFYRDILGLPIRAEHGTYVEFDTGSTILALNTRESARDITALDIPDTSASNTFEIGFVTENVEAVYQKDERTRRIDYRGAESETMGADGRLYR